VSREDLILLDLPPDRQPVLEGEVAVLVLLSLHDGLSTTANLMAPIVVNLKTRRALQAIRQDSLYSHQHPVARVREKAC
jgi:flagellar assembly factor FliW